MMCHHNDNQQGESILERRTLMLGALGAVFNAGCASDPPAPPPYGLIYTETIESLATTANWRTLVVEGAGFNYLLDLDPQLAALLRSDLRTRLAADFGTAHLTPENRLELPVRLSVLATDLTEEEKARFPNTTPTLPGRRVLFDEKLTLKKFGKSELEIRPIGRSPNTKYQIDVMGSYDQSPRFIRRARDPSPEITATGVIQAIPFTIVLLFNGGMPLK